MAAPSPALIAASIAARIAALGAAYPEAETYSAVATAPFHLNRSSKAIPADEVSLLLIFTLHIGAAFRFSFP